MSDSTQQPDLQTQCDDAVLSSVGSAASDTQSSTSSQDVAACLYCGSQEYSLRFQGVRDRLHWVDGTWEFHQCHHCASCTLHPQPRVEDIPSLYPPVYCFDVDQQGTTRLGHLRKRFEYQLFFRPQYWMQTNAVLRHAGFPKAKKLRVLDIGCGRGLRLIPFQSRGHEVFGSDFTPSSVDYVSEHLGIPAVCSNIEELPTHYEDESFDLIMAFYLVEHVHDAKEFTRTCMRLLRPGGALVVAVPMSDAFQCSLFKTRWASVSEAPRHLSLPSQKGLRKLYEESGFERYRFRPDSFLTCCAQVGMSAFPGGLNTHAHKANNTGALANRLMGAVASAAAIPWTLAENYILRRPALGIASGRKPRNATK